MWGHEVRKYFLLADSSVCARYNVWHPSRRRYSETKRRCARPHRRVAAQQYPPLRRSRSPERLRLVLQVRRPTTSLRSCRPRQAICYARAQSREERTSHSRSRSGGQHSGPCRAANESSAGGGTRTRHRGGANGAGAAGARGDAGAATRRVGCIAGGRRQVSRARVLCAGG